MSLLGRPFPLEDVDDVERLCRSLLRDISDHLQWWQYDDCLSDLIGKAIELHAGWDFERTPSFRKYLQYRLTEHEIPNLARRYFGRNKWQWSEYTYERERPAVLSVDAGERVLGESDAVRSILPAPDSLADLRRRVISDRDRCQAEDKRILRKAFARAA
jgi:hypothetical protein